jgi:response regulator RpfG family c-di-GMP phosphodiesterase
MKFEIMEDNTGCTLVVDGETILECQSKQNLLEMSFSEVLHLVAELKDIEDGEPQTEFDRVYRVVRKFALQYGVEEDGWLEEIAQTIIDDNGEGLSEDELNEEAEAFFIDWEG